MPSVMAPVVYEPIKAVRVLSSQGASPQMVRELEGASKTFKLGVPLVLSSGYVQEAAFSGAEIVYGVSAEPAHNLTVAGTAQDLSEGTPPNQTSAVTTPIGAWIRDGRCGLYAANGSTVFSIALKAGQVFTQAMIAASTYYGLTKDGTTGFWYLDNTDTSGDNAVAVVIGVDPSCPNTVAGGSRVFFQFKAALRFFA